MYVEGGCPKSRRESLAGGEEAGGGGRETSIYGCDVSGGRGTRWEAEGGMCDTSRGNQSGQGRW